ncbi:MAG: winged helix-turn-helix transcriptional regulator [Spirochaetales bacterium]|nr:winged helix-turn-helix transcriptional regulator [Spirochaetales bacterium]
MDASLDLPFLRSALRMRTGCSSGDSEKISETIKAKMDPIPSFSFSFPVEDGKRFLLLHVNPGNETPYYFTSDGMRIAYVRVGNESIPADSIALKRLVLKGSRTSYDSLISTQKKADFAFTKLRSVYKNRTGLDFQDSNFSSFGLADENGYLTNAGLLMADEPRLRHSRVFCTRWNGLNKASGIMDAIDDHEFTGSLISLMQDSVAFVMNNMKKKWRKTATVRVEYPDYPERAVQECIVNALIHRDYLEIGSEVHVDMYDDRLVIWSPGGMPDGSLVQNLNLENVASKRRNPLIADLFGRLDFMERRGSGFRKILEDYRFEENFNESKNPVFRSDPYSFSVTLYNLNYGVNDGNTGGETSEEVRKNIGRTSEEHRKNNAIEINPTQKKILELLASNPSMTAVELSGQIGIASRNIEASIRDLKERGMLVRHGSTKAGYWEVLSEEK